MTSDPKARSAKPVNVKISDDVQRGVYANKLIVSHSPDEFVLDFIADFPPGPQIVARVITAPSHLRSMIEALQVNLERHATRFGGSGKARRRTGDAPAEA